MKPLYGHVSPETAYVVNDYPYGFRLRCKIRYWVESHPKKGHRVVTQTTNPKVKDEVWNKPKASTYSAVFRGLYLDDEGHVQSCIVTPYTDPREALRIAEAYQGTGMSLDDLFAWALAKARFDQKLAMGAAFFTVNGVRQPVSDERAEESLIDSLLWRKVAHLTRPTKIQPAA